MTRTPAKPLLYLVRAEARIRGRDFRAEPWLVGEGPRFWSQERILALAVENEQRRKAKRK